MFAVRIVTADFYLASPIKDLDVCYSEFRESDVKKVPVVRIFGATPAVGIRRRHCRGHRPDTAAILASDAFAVTSVHTESGSTLAVPLVIVVLILHKEITADTITVLLEDTMEVHVHTSFQLHLTASTLISSALLLSFLPRRLLLFLMARCRTQASTNECVRPLLERPCCCPPAVLGLHGLR
ncbi:DNA polymerase zeta catalytic subunit [Collichthys lucidus]|uniref:DNA polymerase zeta catalytic subunit n=1 Tax=Collichthys lucidus TaxID=240159 RepID=A0A4U5UN47_COLLU|nr:DNA polymerase zeta catalytic subunit [Collichthys lucidus]